MPKTGNEVKARVGESLLFFPKIPSRSYTLFFGIGRIYKINHGQDFDIVDTIFGVETIKGRKILVIDNHARRQVQTLKKGQYALFYGICVNKYADVEVKAKYGDRMVRPKVAIFYAYMIQGMFVPRTLDIQKLNEDIANGIEEDQQVEMSEKEKNMFQKEVDSILGVGKRIRDLKDDD